MWELQRKCIFIEKKLQKDLVESEKSSTFALAFKNDAWLIRLRIRLALERQSRLPESHRTDFPYTKNLIYFK